MKTKINESKLRELIQNDLAEAYGVGENFNLETLTIDLEEEKASIEFNKEACHVVFDEEKWDATDPQDVYENRDFQIYIKSGLLGHYYEYHDSPHPLDELDYLFIESNDIDDVKDIYYDYDRFEGVISGNITSTVIFSVHLETAQERINKLKTSEDEQIINN